MNMCLTKFKKNNTTPARCGVGNKRLYTCVTKKKKKMCSLSRLVLGGFLGTLTARLSFKIPE